MGTVILVLASIILLSACSILPQEEEVLAPPLVEPPQVERETVQVELGEIFKRVTGIAYFRPTDDRSLYFAEQGGRIKELHVTTGDFVEAGDVLMELETGNLEFDIQMREIDVQRARNDVNHLVNQKADSHSIRQARLGLQQQELQLNRLKEQLNRSRLVSPIDGVVNYVTSKRVGDSVDTYESVFNVADVTKLNLIWEDTSPGSNSVNEVELGMEVSLRYQGYDIRGEVVQTPRNIPDNVPEQMLESFRRSIIIAIDYDELEVEPAYADFADMEIITLRKEDTLIIPRNALREFMGREHLVLSDGGALREVNVEVGITGSTMVEILDGVSEGDEVVLPN